LQSSVDQESSFHLLQLLFNHYDFLLKLVSVQNQNPKIKTHKTCY